MNNYPTSPPTTKPIATRPKMRGLGKLSLRKVDDYLRFVFFLFAIGMLYIWNSHYAEKQIRQRDRLKQEVRVLKAEYVNRKANLSAGTRYTEVVARFDSMGLQKPDEPPYQLKMKK